MSPGRRSAAAAPAGIAARREMETVVRKPIGSATFGADGSSARRRPRGSGQVRRAPPAVRPSHGARIRTARHARCQRARAKNAEHEKPSARWPVRYRVDSPSPVRRHPTTPCTRRTRRGRRRTPRRCHSPSAWRRSASSSNPRRRKPSAAGHRNRGRTAPRRHRTTRRTPAAAGTATSPRRTAPAGTRATGSSHLRPARGPAAALRHSSLIRHVMKAATPALPSTDRPDGWCCRRPIPRPPDAAADCGLRSLPAATR